MQTWRGQLEYLKQLRQGASEASQLGSQLDQYYSARTYAEDRERLQPQIEKDAAGELRGVYNNYAAALDGLDQARSAEVARWDDGKRLAALQLADALVSRSKTPDELQARWTEARQSNNMYTVRAMAEALADAPRFEDTPARIAVDHLQRESQRALAVVRSTEDVRASERIVTQARDKMVALVGEAGEVLREFNTNVFFGNGPLVRQLRRFRLDGATGDVTILGEDHPDVLGVRFVSDPVSA